MAFLRFSVDSALLRELGEKLVETVHLALVELVKNCYDADATEVEIIFTTNDNGATIIKVIDNGTGMSHTSVKDYWMRIATSNKEDRKVSTVFGRPLTGAKGIGRFCCRRLGNRLTLITKGTANGKTVGKQSKIEYTEVEFPWMEFEPGTDVTDIKCKGDQTFKNGEITGTTLIISGISEEWSHRGLNWLKRQLAVLAANRGVKREGFKEDPGFNVKLIAPDFEGGIRDLRDDLMNAGWGTLTAYINKKHQAVCELNALGIGRKTITSSQKFSALRDISLEIAIMVDQRDQMRDTGVLSQGTLQKILPEWGGVQVRYRNFRVYPYGDNDWLEIDRDRGLRKGNPNSELFAFAQSLRGVDPSRSLLNLLSMRSYVGNVNIGEEADGFEMKLNREGFLSSVAVDQLKDFVRFTIDWSTILRDYYIRQESQRHFLIAKGEFENIIDQKIDADKVVTEAVSFLEHNVRSIIDHLPEKEAKEIEISFTKATEAIRKHNESNQAELSHLRLVASTSTLLLIFSHEVKSLLGLLEQSKNSLTLIAKNMSSPKHQRKVNEISASFSELKDRLEELLQLTSLVGSDHRKSKPSQIALKEKIARVEKVFELVTNKYEITIDYSGVPANIVIKKILEAELYSILLNVLSNSIKSVIAAGRNRIIQINAVKDGIYNIITIKDTGLGLKESSFEEVFIPFIADPEGKLYQNLDSRLNPEDNLIVGTGSGLGLGIVKEIVNAHDGTVEFVKPQKDWNAELVIKLP
ncbi:sensor histidine kinase [Ohtaekwangia kribbensis]|uniref:histidine kinase n=1 Tax=Ohtaekwangia kribbensis TaxID=688913 RepID=A0ABW3JXA8_9BACT